MALEMLSELAAKTLQREVSKLDNDELKMCVLSSLLRNELSIT